MGTHEIALTKTTTTIHCTEEFASAALGEPLEEYLTQQQQEPQQPQPEEEEIGIPMEDLQLISEEDLMAAELFISKEDLMATEEAVSEILDLLCYEKLGDANGVEEEGEAAAAAAAVETPHTETPPPPATTATDMPIRESKLYYTYKAETFVGERPYAHTPKVNPNNHAPISCVDGTKCRHVLLGGSVLYKCSIIDDCLFLKVMYNNMIPETGVLKLDELLRNMEQTVKKVHINGSANALDAHEYNVMKLKKCQVTSQRVLDALISLSTLTYSPSENVDVAAAVVARMCEIELEQRSRERNSGMYFGVKESVLFGLQPAHVQTRYQDLDRAFAAVVADAQKLVDERGYIFDAFVYDILSAVAVSCCYKEEDDFIMADVDGLRQVVLVSQELTMKIVNDIALNHFKDNILQQQCQPPPAPQQQQQQQVFAANSALETQQRTDADAMVRAVRKKDSALLKKLCAAYAPASSDSPSPPYYEPKLPTVTGAPLNSISMDRTEIAVLLTTLRDSGVKLRYLEFDSCIMSDERRPLVSLEPFHMDKLQFTNCTTNIVTVTSILDIVTPETTVSFFNMPLSQFDGYDRTVFPMLKNRKQKGVRVYWSYNPLANTAMEIAQGEITASEKSSKQGGRSRRRRRL